MPNRLHHGVHKKKKEEEKEERREEKDVCRMPFVEEKVEVQFPSHNKSQNSKHT